MRYLGKWWGNNPHPHYMKGKRLKMKIRIDHNTNPYDKRCPHRYHALIYLAYEKNESDEFIAELFGYTTGTVRTYRSKYYYRREEAKELFKTRKILDLIENPLGYDLDIEDNYFYLIKFYDVDNNFLMSKVGTTTKSLRTRLKQHFNSDTPYHRMGAEYLVLDRAYSCERNPKGIENALKGELMKKYELIGQDQFPVDLNWDDYEDFIQNYLN